MRVMKLPYLSRKQRLILELLDSQSFLRGLDLIERSRGSLKRGTVYVTLGRMADRGLVTSKATNVVDSGLPVRRYRATELGKKLLRLWQEAERVTADLKRSPEDAYDHDE